MSGELRVLIVEDSEDDALLLVDELERGGYQVAYQRVDTAEAIRSALHDGGCERSRAVREPVRRRSPGLFGRRADRPSRARCLPRRRQKGGIRATRRLPASAGNDI